MKEYQILLIECKGSINGQITPNYQTKRNNYFTASFKAFPATNFGTLLAAISISSPV
jgi:hypothetical protein